MKPFRLPGIAGELQRRFSKYIGSTIKRDIAAHAMDIPAWDSMAQGQLHIGAGPTSKNGRKKAKAAEARESHRTPPKMTAKELAHLRRWRKAEAGRRARKRA